MSAPLARSLALALAALTAHGSVLAKDLPAFTGACDHPDGVYSAGQPVIFTITRNPAAKDAPAKISVLRNDSENLQQEEIAPGAQSATLNFSAPSEDWFVCSVSTPAEKKPLEAVGAVFDPHHFQPSSPMPDDFDAFWAAQKARLSAAKAVPILEPLTTAQREVEGKVSWQKERIEKLETEGFVGENLEIPCLDYQPVRGYLAHPKNAQPGGHPLIVLFHAAGVDAEWCRSSYVNALAVAKQFNAVVLDLNAHGMLNGQPQDYYAALCKGELTSYQTMGRESRDTFYFLGMFLRLQRAIDYLTTRPEWNGRDLICLGISQGGAQALAAAGLDSRVTAVVATVPGMCDITGRLALRPSSWPGIGEGNLADEKTKAILNTVRYFDNTNFCTRSKAATLITVGFADTTCPAPGIFAAYNQLQSPKEIITVPAGNHHSLSSPTRELQMRYDAFVRDHLSKSP